MIEDSSIKIWVRGFVGRGGGICGFDQRGRRCHVRRKGKNHVHRYRENFPGSFGVVFLEIGTGNTETIRRGWY